MSLVLPLSGSPVRELFDVAHLVEIADPANRAKLATFRECISNARKMYAGNKAIKAVHSFCLRANGELWLIRVGPRGGWKKVWNFGTL